jgi:hypothetical protein
MMKRHGCAFSPEGAWRASVLADATAILNYLDRGFNQVIMLWHLASPFIIDLGLLGNSQWLSH